MTGAQDVLQNNGFEDGVAANDLMAVLDGSTFIEGWQVGGGTPSQGVNLRANPLWCTDGRQSVQIGGPNGPGRIWQDVTIQPFHNYILAFSLNSDGPSEENSYSIYFNDVHFYTGSQTTGYWYGVSALVSGLSSPTQRLEFRSIRLNQGAILDEIYFFKFGTGVLVGDVALAGYLGSTNDLDITVGVYDDVTGAPVADFPATLNSGGRYEISSIPVGLYTFTCDGPTAIRQRHQHINTYEYVNELNFELILGDLDGSGEIDAADIDLVIEHFGELAPTNYDVDGSGEVDAADIDMVIANFGAVDE